MIQRALRCGLIAAFLWALPLAGEAPLPRVAIQPLGPIPDAAVRNLRDDLAGAFAFEFVLLPRAPLPAAAYYPPRKRYRALALLDWLREQRPRGAFRILGVTGRDISTPKPPHADWGIFGLAYLDGTPAVVSSFRLGRRGAVSRRTRLFRVAAHELGHTLDLEHCETPRCLMNDARGALRSVDEGAHFCPRCARALGERLRPAPNPLRPAG